MIVIIIIIIIVIQPQASLVVSSASRHLRVHSEMFVLLWHYIGARLALPGSVLCSPPNAFPAGEQFLRVDKQVEDNCSTRRETCGTPGDAFSLKLVVRAFRIRHRSGRLDLELCEEMDDKWMIDGW